MRPSYAAAPTSPRARLGSSRDHRPRRRTDPLLRRLQHARSARRRSGVRAAGRRPAVDRSAAGDPRATGSRSSRRGSTGAPPRSTTTTDPAATGGRTSSRASRAISPLDAVVVMLGTNDLKTCFDRTADEIAEALRGYLDDVALNVDRPSWADPRRRPGQPDPDRRHRAAVRGDDRRQLRQLRRRAVAASWARPSVGSPGNEERRTPTPPRSLAPAMTASTSRATRTLGSRSSWPRRSPPPFWTDSLSAWSISDPFRFGIRVWVVGRIRVFGRGG